MDKWIIDILSHAIVSLQKHILYCIAHKFSDIALEWKGFSFLTLECSLVFGAIGFRSVN